MFWLLLSAGSIITLHGLNILQFESEEARPSYCAFCFASLAMVLCCFSYLIYVAFGFDLPLFGLTSLHCNSQPLLSGCLHFDLCM